MSHQPGDTLSLPSFPGIDKVLHAFAYAVLAASAMYAFPAWSSWPEGRYAGAGLVLFCVLYGISDEFHQTFIPGRTATLGDLVADAVGAGLSVYALRRYLGRH